MTGRFPRWLAAFVAVLAAIGVLTVLATLPQTHVHGEIVTPTKNGLGPDTNVPNGGTAPAPKIVNALPVKKIVAGGYGGHDAFVNTRGMPRTPFTPAEAVAVAKGEVKHPTHWWKGMCEGATAFEYGWAYSGFYSARVAALSTPKKYRHPIGRGGRNIPLGAKVMFTGGTYGHATLAVGYKKSGEVLLASNDVKRVGKLDIVPISWFASHWGMTFSFWTPPYFPLAGGRSAKRPHLTHKPVTTPVHVVPGKPVKRPTPKPTPKQGKPAGPDVSSYQGRVRWARVARAKIAGRHVGFSFAKATEGTWVDPTFARNWPRMKKTGVRGAYDFGVFSHSPTREANLFLAAVKHNGGFRARGDFAVLDAEAPTGGKSRAQVEAWIRVWVHTVKAGTGLPSGRVVVYTGKWWTDSHLTDSGIRRLAKSGTRLWLSDYAAHPARGLPGWTASWVQYTDRARVAGISGRSDASYWRADMASLRRAAGL